MNAFFRRQVLTGALAALAATGLTGSVQAETKEEPVTYIALVWMNPGQEENMAKYEQEFRKLLGKNKVAARPLEVSRPSSINTNWPDAFGYRMPDRIDVVKFPNATAWPEIAASDEWLAIKPLRDEALERLIIWETKSLIDGAH